MPVTFAIGLKGHATPVRFAAVELDDQALCPPEAIRFYHAPAKVEKDVELGLRQVRTGK